MGYENCGRKTISENSAEVKHRLAEIAKTGVKYLGECAEGKVKPSPRRAEIILAAIEHTIGRPKQQVDTTLKGQLTLIDQMRALSDEQLAAIIALAKLQKGGDDAT